MDPNATLRELRELVAALQTERGDPPVGTAEQAYASLLEAAEEAAERFAALDRWMSRGGFPPAAWEHPDVPGLVTRIHREQAEWNRQPNGSAHHPARAQLAGLAVALADAVRRTPADA